MGNIPSPLPAAAYFPRLQIGALPTLGVPTLNLGVAAVRGAMAAPTLTDTLTLMPGEGARLMPDGGARIVRRGLRF